MTLRWRQYVERVTQRPTIVVSHYDAKCACVVVDLIQNTYLEKRALLMKLTANTNKAYSMDARFGLSHVEALPESCIKDYRFVAVKLKVS